MTTFEPSVPRPAPRVPDLWRRGGGVVGFVLALLLVTQSAHMVEHVVQVVQFYLLRLAPARSAGILADLNVEWVHFIWNWSVVTGVVVAIVGGLRGRWAWLLLVVAVAHSSEHSYLFFRYLRLREAMLAFGLSELQVAQALPGLLGRDGLLSTFCQIPGLTTASRVSVHFWWNSIELALLVLAARPFFRDLRLRPRGENA